MKCPLPSFAQLDQLWAVAAVSADDVIAAGFRADGYIPRGLVEQWNGATWSVVRSKSDLSQNRLFEAVEGAPSGSLFGVQP